MRPGEGFAHRDSTVLLYIEEQTHKFAVQISDDTKVLYID